MDNYARYQPDHSSPWGAVLCASGYTVVKPGDTYPAMSHPLDHGLSWERGRVLPNHQLIWIAAGEGEFESHASGLRQVKAGDAIWLFPNTWHRYRPHPQVGWTESWMEFQGPVIESLLAEGIFSPSEPVLTPLTGVEIEATLRQLHEWVLASPRGYQGVLAGKILQILALLRVVPENSPEALSVDRIIQEACQWMTEALGHPEAIEEMVGRWPVSYSYFRRVFRARLGMSPKQYHLQLRLRKCQELLAGTNQAIGQIAESLGFSSTFHFSSWFKAQVGHSPRRWREEHRTLPPREP